MVEKKLQCDCIERLDKLRMDVEAGKDVGFVVVFFNRGDEADGRKGEYDSIIHDVSPQDMMLGVLELTVGAMKKRGDLEART